MIEYMNLYPRSTGLPMTIWLTPGLPHVTVANDHMKHVEPNYDYTAEIAIEEDPYVTDGGLAGEDFDEVAVWIGLNRDGLLAYVSGEIDAAEFSERMRKLLKQDDD